MQMSRSIARIASSCCKLKLIVALVAALAIVVLLSRNVSTAFPFYQCLSVNSRTDWSSMDVNTMTAKQIMDYFRWNNASSCRLAQYFGGVTFLFGIDGQKAVCMDPEIMPLAGKCIVYSFGINDDWSFEEMIDRYGCDVYAFDPSLNMTTRNWNDTNIHYFHLGLADHEEQSDDGWHVQTLSTIYQKLLTEKLHASDRFIDYLKIDIEEDEWTVLVDILHSGMLGKVRQLAVEVHLPLEGSISDYQRLVGLLRSMEEQHGMIRFDSKINAYSEGSIRHLFGMGYAAHEMAWYNRRPLHYYNE
ncbi:uncharacterized protein LOC130688510 [Daphnia carinata]|uniref:uncharacterized protein LOC130688510 n=1 Tax=Daphnia carinata TaxID=120202 RepID=UPI0028694ED3|nr:uncharacterized protein LOC130688510 [Daphnia carinata]